MNDNFEIFVKDAILNQTSYLSQNHQSWMAIEKKLRKRKTKKHILYFGIAASILLFTGLGALFIQHENNPAVDYYTATTLEINETEYYYASLIDIKYRQIAETKSFNKEYFQPFFDEMEQLDNEYAVYLNDAREFGFQEDITRAMINNQQRKLQILNRLLEEINKIKEYENRNINI